MKRFSVLMLGILALGLVFAGCSSSHDSEDVVPVENVADVGGEQAVKSGCTLSADASISSAGEIRDIDLGGHTLTVRANGVVIVGAKNGRVVIGSEVGEGDFTIRDSTIDELSVEGGGQNSIHVNGVTVGSLLARKDNVRVVLEGVTKVNEMVASAQTMFLETAAGCSAKVENLKAEVTAQTVKILNSTVVNTKIVCGDNESFVRDVIVAKGSSFENILPVNGQGATKSEFVPVIEILPCDAGKKGIKFKLSNWNPSATNVFYDIYRKGKEFADDDGDAGPKYIAGLNEAHKFTSDTREYKWIDAGTEYTIIAGPFKKGDLGSGYEIHYPRAFYSFRAESGDGEYDLKDANGNPCVATLDEDGVFHWVTKPAFIYGKHQGLKFRFNIFSDGENWMWVGTNEVNLDGMTEEQMFADYTFDVTGFCKENVTSKGIYAQVGLIDSEGDLIGEPVHLTNTVDGSKLKERIRN